MKAFNHSLCRCERRKCRFALFRVLHGLVYRVNRSRPGGHLTAEWGPGKSGAKSTAGPQITWFPSMSLRFTSLCYNIDEKKKSTSHWSLIIYFLKSSFFVPLCADLRPESLRLDQVPWQTWNRSALPLLLFLQAGFFPKCKEWACANRCHEPAAPPRSSSDTPGRVELHLKVPSQVFTEGLLLLLSTQMLFSISHISPKSPEYLNVGNSPTPQSHYVQKGSYSITTHTQLPS